MERSKMEYRTLGRTNLRVSAIGFGGIPIQRVSVDEAVEVLKQAHALGVNFVDTGIVYTDSEAKIGKAIAGQRDEWIISSKSPAIDYAQAKKDIEQSLKNLGVEYIDMYMIHHLKDDSMLKLAMSPDGCYRALKEAKEGGKIKSIGVSSHDYSTLVLAAKTGLFDAVMVNFNYREQEALAELIPYCQQNNIGVIVMKPLAGGAFQNAGAAVRFCLSAKGVSCAIPGICNQRELEEDIADVLKAPAYTKSDQEALAKEVEAVGKPFCRACGYCITQDGGCPSCINITLMLRLEGYFQKYGPLDWIMDTYYKSVKVASECILCGHCEKVCPFSLPIMRILRDLKIEEKAKAVIGKGKKRDYQKEYQEFVDLAQRKLGDDHTIPLAYYYYPKSSNEGQKATVRGLYKEMLERVKPDTKKEREILDSLRKDMGISKDGVNSFENLLALSDYNNVVDLMRILPVLR